jgi:hypothetical protein
MPSKEEVVIEEKVETHLTAGVITAEFKQSGSHHSYKLQLKSEFNLFSWNVH